MPYYRWRGIDAWGVMRSGAICSHNYSALEERLLKKDIALISCVSTRPFFQHSIDYHTKAVYFQRLATLLEAGILIPQAHIILLETMENKAMQLVIDTIVDDLLNGKSLSIALEKHQRVFDDRMVQMVLIGQESGCLAHTCQAMAHYLETYIEFSKSVWSALSMPLISFGFFILVTLVIIFCVIPVVTGILQSTNQPLSYAVQFLLASNTFLRSCSSLIIIACLLGGLFLGIRYLRKKNNVVHFFHGSLLHLPLIGKIICNMQQTWFFDSLALLLHGGMQLVPAIFITQRSCTNVVLRQRIAPLYNAVIEGSSLAQALELCEQPCFSLESLAIIHVGQETGNLVPSIEQAAKLSRARAMHSLNFITTCIQPIFLIILGLLITLLIISIYSSIFAVIWSI